MIEAAGSDWVEIYATEGQVEVIKALGYEVEQVSFPESILAFPPEDADFHDYAEMVAKISQAATDHPDIIDLFSIGQSYEGQELWAAKVSDNPTVDEDEPEVLFSIHQHANEHLTVEHGQVVHLWRLCRQL